MDLARKYEVSLDGICWRCHTDDFSFECTDELAAPQGLIGQARALKAIQFGLEVEKRGYNLFVTGLTGTGKASAIKRHLQAIIDERKGQGVPLPHIRLVLRVQLHRSRQARDAKAASGPG